MNEEDNYFAQTGKQWMMPMDGELNDKGVKVTLIDSSQTPRLNAHCKIAT